MKFPDSVLAAADSADFYQIVRHTPLQRAPTLCEQLKRQVLVKREDMQSVFSFKCRGAANRLNTLVRQNSHPLTGVAAASAGNHAQGLAISARHHKLPCTIVMPRTTPDVKVKAVHQLGAEVVLEGDHYDQAAEVLKSLAQERDLTCIHPFDEDDVIGGQGTVAKEILDEHPGKLDVVFVPAGGGGLLAGMAAYIKSVRPEVRVIGVEPEDSACVQAAMEAGKRVVLDEVGTFVDGVAVRQVGARTFPLIRDYCDGIITVSIDEICSAVSDLYEEFRVLAEPAGALATAGLRKWCEEGRDGNVLVSVLSGANTNFERLGHIVERSTLVARRELLLCVRIPEQPGSFLQLCETLGDCDVSEFNYRHHDDDSEAQIFIGLRQMSQSMGQAAPTSAPSPLPLPAPVQELIARGYKVLDLSDNELAKDHLRYMVGGHNQGQQREREAVYSFHFPERPGALKTFLQNIGSAWNITLFHYRNHGSAYGRVFAGFDLGAKSRADLEKDLAHIGYRFQAENANPAYRQFLR